MITKCTFCGYTPSVETPYGCIPYTVWTEDGQQHTRIPFGRDRLRIRRQSCPGCYAPRGRYHHDLCVIERCPVCRIHSLNTSHECTVIRIYFQYSIDGVIYGIILGHPTITTGTDAFLCIRMEDRDES
jgi:hypothetical protein